MTQEPTPPAAEPQAAAPAPASAPTLIMPGVLIREARQAARLSVDELAAMMKIARPTIEAMERDDFGAMLEPVYARGYYRKCAKLLGIDEKKLLDAYAAHVAQREPVMPNKVRLASGSELGLGSRLPLGRALVVGVGAIIFCAVLWIVRDATLAEPAVPPMLPATTSAPAVHESGAGPGAATPSTPAEAAPGTPPADTASVSPGPADAAAATGAPTPAAAVAPGSAAAAPAPATAPSPAAAPPSGALQLTFTADCWVNIRDVNGRTLRKGLILAGERIGLDGARPFYLFLGKATAVSVQFDGKPVDLAPYTRDNATAKLQLPLPIAPPTAPAAPR